MSRYPLITVIVPVYNVLAYLPKCVHSITAQTYENLEIILVDDGSTDGTGELCDRLAGEDSRIRVFHKENGGSSQARNLALEQAAGEYVGFVDSDDYIERDMYEKLLKAIQEFGVRAAQTGRDEIDEQGNLLPNICEPPESTRVLDSKTFLEELLLHKGDCSFCTKLIRRDMFPEEAFPEGKLNEDFHVLVKMLPEIKGIVSIPERVYNVFYKSGSNTRTGSVLKFSRVYGDNVENADMVTDLVRKHYPELEKTALRFGLYQRLDYMLHIPIRDMNGRNGQYQGIVRHLRENRGEILRNQELTGKQKAYLLLFSVMPVLIRKVHRALRSAG